MKHYLLLLACYLFVAFCSNILAQNFDPDSLVGTYEGQWFNDTFGSSGDATLVVTFDANNSTMQFVLDLDGFVGGMSDPDPRTLNGTYDNSGATIDSTGGSEGDLHLTWGADGVIDYLVTNITTPGFTTQGGTGTGNSSSIIMDYFVEFSTGDSAFGRVEMFKQPPTSVDDIPDANHPYNYRLYKNYPNPFNPSTNIFFSIPEEADVTIKVYNNVGEQVAVLIEQRLAEGTYNLVFNAQNLPSGVYYYRMTANSFVKTNKMVLLK